MNLRQTTFFTTKKSLGLIYKKETCIGIETRYDTSKIYQRYKNVTELWNTWQFFIFDY